MLLSEAKQIIKKLPDYLLSARPEITYQVAQTLGRDDVWIASRWLSNRSSWQDSEMVKSFESDFAMWNGSDYAFSFMGGRVALSACIQALDLIPGDEVILPGYTCVVVANALKFAGIKAVFCDIELETYGLDLRQLERKISPNTRAIILQHSYGLVCRDYEAILDFANELGLKVIEDCAHSAGAEFKGIKVGNRGDVAFYSTNRSKVFTTVEGGIVTTNDKQLSSKIEKFYNQCSYPDEALIEKLLYNVFLDYYGYSHPMRSVTGEWIRQHLCGKYHYSISVNELSGICPSGYYAKMPAPLAALGSNQIRKINTFNDRRRKTALKWDSWCEKNKYTKPKVIKESRPVFLRYPVLVEPEKKADTSWVENELKIELGVWFTSNLHPSEFVVEGCEKANIAVKRCVNLPGIYSRKI